MWMDFSLQYLILTDMGCLLNWCITLIHWHLAEISRKTFSGIMPFLDLWDFGTSLWKGPLTKGLIPGWDVLKVDFVGYWERQNDVLWAKINPHLTKIFSKTRKRSQFFCYIVYSVSFIEEVLVNVFLVVDTGLLEYNTAAALAWAAGELSRKTLIETSMWLWTSDWVRRGALHTFLVSGE